MIWRWTTTVLLLFASTGIALSDDMHILSEPYPLVEKGVLYVVDYSRTEPMCEVPKLLRDDREAIIAAVPTVRALIS
jgi:hypothetical protein